MHAFRFSLSIVPALASVATADAQVPHVLYYRMNEAAGTTTRNEAIPGGGLANPTITGTYVWETPGHLGPVHIDFGSTGSAIGTVQTQWATDLTNDWTIEYWFRPNVGGNTLGAINTPGVKLTIQP